MQINATVDPSAAIKHLAECQKQIPFALSLALNKTANDVQADIRTNVRARFRLRREQFILNTVKRVRPDDFATKQKLEAAVRIDETRDYLAKFEAGGEKRPSKGGRHIAVPIDPRLTKSGVIAAAQRPRRLLSSKAFESGRVFLRNAAILQSVRKGKQTITRKLYILKDRVRIPARLGFMVTARETIARRWAPNGEAAVAQAIATARRT